MSVSSGAQANHAASAEALSLEADLTKEIADRRLKLPVLPNVASEVLSSSLDDSADAARLASLIQQDQSLATHVLRVVNSPAFRGRAEIVALQQAIARLGMVRIREIALTASLKNALPAKGSFQELMDAAWRHGLAVGLWSKEVARSTRRNVEQAYLSGLLHNVGESLIAVDLSNRAPALTLADAAYLMRALGRDAGQALVTEWQLPGAVSTCIRYLGNFANAGEEADDIAVIELGDAFARSEEGDGNDFSQFAAAQALNLYPEDITTLMEHRETITTTLESMVL